MNRRALLKLWAALGLAATAPRINAHKGNGDTSVVDAVDHNQQEPAKCLLGQHNASHIQVGDIWFDGSEGLTWIWNGTEWIELEDVQ